MKSRTNVKESSHAQSRKSRNERRQELSQRIRKNRRSHTLQLKRRIVRTTEGDDGEDRMSNMNNGTGTCTTLVFASVVQDWLTTPNSESLKLVLQSLSQSSTSSSSPSSSLQVPQTVANQFLSCLINVLQSMTEDSIIAARILTNVAALDNDTTSTCTPPETSEDEDSYYYGHNTAATTDSYSYSWCDLLLNQPTFLSTSISYLTTVQSHPMNATARSMSASCAWILGNVAGDSSHSRRTLLQYRNTSQSNGTIVSVVSACIHMEVLVTRRRNGMEEEQQQGNGEQDLELLRNALWALTNLARGAETSAVSFVNANANATHGHATVITGELIVQLLSPPLDKCLKDAATKQQQQQQGQGRQGQEQNEQVTWIQIMTETYWLLAFLTAREEEAVQVLLLQTQTGGSSSNENVVGRTLCHTMVTHFCYLSQVLLMASTTTRGSINANADNSVVQMATQMILPMIRTLGNIATSSGGIFVPTLLYVPVSNTPPASSGSLSLSSSSSLLCQSIVTWMQLLERGRGGSSSFSSSDGLAIAMEVTWMTGTLLCDVGHAHHVSTTVACPILIPALCRALVHPRLSLEWKRHLLWAIWNALSQPPDKEYNNSMDSTSTSISMEQNGNEEEDTRPVRDAVLKEVYGTPQMCYALVQNLDSSDVDVIQVSLNILDAMHRRLVGQGHQNQQSWTVLQQFQEVDCLNALERVCDTASAAYSYGGGRSWQDSNFGMEACAELAADLIDDFYQDDLEEEEGDGGFSSGGTAVDTNGQLVFQFAPPPGGSVTPVAQAPMTSSLGRGRGRVVPAWMQASQPS